jgi:hypothetical protein
MSLISQFARMIVLASIPDSILPSKTMSCSPDSCRFPRGFERGNRLLLSDRRLPSIRLCSTEHFVKSRAQADSGMTASGFCPIPSSVFDTRLYSVTGSGHIRRPAALGLLLRFAPSWVPVPPKRNSLQNRPRTPSEFLSVPTRKADRRHLGAGPTSVASPCVTRANSGIQNGEQKCI